jgi:hypothetical protein
MQLDCFDSVFGKSREEPTESERKCSRENTVVPFSLYNKGTLRADNSHWKEIHKLNPFVLLARDPIPEYSRSPSIALLMTLAVGLIFFSVSQRKWRSPKGLSRTCT